MIYECEARDIVLVHLTPIRRRDFPATANSILTRMQEGKLKLNPHVGNVGRRMYG